MKKSKFSEAQILKVLQMQEEGKKVQEICREQGLWIVFSKI
jgi:putative transposase